MRIVFMGTPEFAVPSLEVSIGAGYEVVGAVTQPDRPVGRKGKLTPPPVKVCAQQHGIPVLQFERIRRPEGREALEALKPDLFVTAAFGQILSAALGSSYSPEARNGKEYSLSSIPRTYAAP